MQNDVDHTIMEIQVAIEKYIYGLLRHAAKLVKSELRSEVDRQGLVASGRMRGSFKSDILKTGTQYIMQMHSLEPQTNWIDQGVRPHFPPTQSIANWIRTKRRRGAFAIDNSEVEHVAFLIARKMAHKGIGARHFVKIALDRAIPQIKQYAERI
jgi:hypothetical protein